MVAEIEFLENGVKGGEAGLERLARGMMNVSEIEFYSAGVKANNAWFLEWQRSHSAKRWMGALLPSSTARWRTVFTSALTPVLKAAPSSEPVEGRWVYGPARI